MDPAPPPIPIPPVPPPPPPITSNNFNKKFILLAVVVAILLITLISILAFYIISRPTQVQQIPQPSNTPMPTQTPVPAPTTTPASPVASISPTPNSTQVLTLNPRPNMDGYFSSSGTGSNTGDLRIGRNTYAVTRSFLSFDLASLPQNVTIQSAVLRLYQNTISGNPYSAIGTLYVDHLDFGATLEAEDYNLPALQSKFAILTSNTQSEWKEVVVTEQIRFDKSASKLYSQFRILFDKERIGGTTGGDFAYFESAENFGSSGNLPQLVITYNLQ